MTDYAEKQEYESRAEGTGHFDLFRQFAVRLRMLREKAGLSIEELAEMLEVKPITIYTWELWDTCTKYRRPSECCRSTAIKGHSDTLSEKIEKILLFVKYTP
jgi:DNA-binding XRE family transcriptional regulator